MTRKIRYKPVSKELEKIVKPVESPSLRASIGMEGAVGEFFYLSTEDLIPFKNQARITFDDKEIKELADSIKEYGVRQPLTVLRNEDKKYEVVSGERRLRAAKLIGLEKVPCIVLKHNEEADAVALIENVHRKDLHPIELGSAYRKLLEKNIFKSQDELAEKISVSKSKVSEYIKYSTLPHEIQSYIIEHNISSRDKLRALVSVNNDIEKMKSLLGITKQINENFSILRIAYKKGKITLQDSGIKKLSREDKDNLAQQLLDVIRQLSVK
jgi:ParB family transcriptional regulator, chromosome partitioning protein